MTRRIDRHARRWPTKAICCLALMALVACGARSVSRDSVARIRPGMTEAEVKAILGEPAATNTIRQVAGIGANDADRLPETLIYSYRSGGDTAGVYFESGKVVAASFGEEFLFSNKRKP